MELFGNKERQAFLIVTNATMESEWVLELTPHGNSFGFCVMFLLFVMIIRWVVKMNGPNRLLKLGRAVTAAVRQEKKRRSFIN